ncbi:MAG: glycosyltransferase family 4 protein [Candidatus Pacebacteria bacterium]|jgi:glycosyltransferase involved in cell wall biosynthesis|nr:glycosyltransferase family 4 protein [Candidatus Paceibacterota bacterium]MDP6659550.1 glycosyltransferase family 4 protein [Candidatus Paceibacterota bacterium]|tara:strand:+ start:5646 stop:6770 length:1125 start_codon:yes stop_codon:yes gene_type:complete
MRKKVIYFITKSNFGGAQKQVLDLATLLDGSKFDVAVACGGSGSLVKKLKNAGIRVIKIKGMDRDVRVFKDFQAFISTYKILKEEEPDIIHLHSSKAAAMGAFLGKLTGVGKIIFTAHGWPFKEDRGVFWKIVTWAGSLVTSVLSDKIIVVSKNDFKKTPNLFSKNKLHLIHNGVGEIEFLSKRNARSKLTESMGESIPADAMWIGTGIELTPNKGLEYTIDAFKRLSKSNKDIYLFIFGEGELREKLKNLINNYSLNKKVFLLGHIDNMPQYLKALDVYAQTSTKEGLPYAILEAGARALPVVASDIGGMPEIIEHRKSGLLVPSKDEKAIANALNLIIKDKDLGDRLGKGLKKKVNEEFSLEDMKNKIFSLY